MNNRVICDLRPVASVIFTSMALFILTLSSTFGDEVVKKNRKGIELFNEGQYDEALGAYRDAQLEAPESPELHFNIGNTLYKQKKYEQAQEEYMKALSTEDALLQSQIFYNIGNSQYRLNKLVESIDSYKKSLEINPDDMDAKYNLEFVRNKLKEMAQQQQQQGGQQEQQMQQQEQEQQPGGQSQEGEEGQEQQSQGQPGEEEQQEGVEEQPQQQKAEGEMTEEEARRILDALKDDELEVQKKMRRMPQPGKRRVEKDW
ncbi:MAG: tetratricopeptide repeat protein [bacterium]